MTYILIKEKLQSIADIVMDALGEDYPEEFRVVAFRHLIRQNLNQTLETKEGPHSVTALKEIPPGVAIQRMGARTFVEKTLALGVIASRRTEEGVFTVEDLRRMFVAAKQKQPQNLSDTINRAIKQGWLAEHPDKKDGLRQIYVTQEGLDEFESRTSDK